MLRFTVHIPALNNSPQLKEFFRVCAPALPWSSAPGKPACPQAVPVTPPAGLSLVQGGEVTRPSEVSGDLHILPPPLIPTPPPDEPRVQPHETWLPQPLPAERRGLEELEVPGMWSRRASQGWRVQSLSVWGVGTTPSSMKSLSCLLYHYPAEELCPGHFPSQGYSLLICKMGTNRIHLPWAAGRIPRAACIHSAEHTGLALPRDEPTRHPSLCGTRTSAHVTKLCPSVLL